MIPLFAATNTREILQKEGQEDTKAKKSACCTNHVNCSGQLTTKTILSTCLMIKMPRWFWRNNHKPSVMNAGVMTVTITVIQLVRTTKDMPRTRAKERPVRSQGKWCLRTSCSWSADSVKEVERIHVKSNSQSCFCCPSLRDLKHQYHVEAGEEVKPSPQMIIKKIQMISTKFLSMISVQAKSPMNLISSPRSQDGDGQKCPHKTLSKSCQKTLQWQFNTVCCKTRFPTYSKLQ